jgi:hypothetical protein
LGVSRLEVFSPNNPSHKKAKCANIALYTAREVG